MNFSTPERDTQYFLKTSPVIKHINVKKICVHYKFILQNIHLITHRSHLYSKYHKECIIINIINCVLFYFIK